MRGLFNLGIATLASLITNSLAIPIIAHPGGKDALVLTVDNTVNSTHTASSPVVSSNPLEISIINNFGSDSLTAYITGLDSNNLVVFLSPDGTFYYPDAGGSKTPVAIQVNLGLALNGQGKTTQFTIPDYISSGRIWVSVGTLDFFTVEVNGLTSLVEPSFANPNDPSADVNWGFIEFTNNAGGIYANISFVDFVGLVMGMSLTLASGVVQTVHGLAAGAITNICSDLAAQTAADGQPWNQMCVTDSSGKALRVLSPNIYASINPGSMESYYDDYVSQVWAKYASEPLIIDTQGYEGNVSCQVVNNNLTCAGDNRGYAKPSTADIWGCNSGPFAILAGDNDIHAAIVPRLCAAFTRGTLLLSGGNVQPSLASSSYYPTSPNNHYSEFVHKYETDGLGYAFSYDDVNPSGENQAGVVAGLNPQSLQITVGGY